MKSILNFAKKWIKWIITAVILLLAVYFLRSCVRNDIQKKNIYLIGRNSNWYPLQLYGKEKNLQAFTNDLLTVVSKEAGVHFHIAESSASTLLGHLNDEVYDIIITSIRPNALTRKNHLFSELIYETGPVLIVREDSPFHSLLELKGLTIGAVEGTSLIFNAVRASGANLYELTFITYPNINQALDVLLRNYIDGVIADTLPAYALTEGFYKGRIKVITAPLNDEGLRLMTLKNPSSQALIEEFDILIDKLKHDGTYDALLEKWNLINPEKRFSTPKGT